MSKLNSSVRKYTKTYTEETLQVALAAIKRGAPKLLVAKKYGIPRATLQFRLGTKFVKTRHRPNTYLTEIEEKLLSVQKNEEFETRDISEDALILLKIYKEFYCKTKNLQAKSINDSEHKENDTINDQNIAGTPSKECNVRYSAAEILNMPIVILSENEKTNQPCVKSSLNDNIENYLVWTGKRQTERLPYVITSTAFKNVCEEKTKAKTEKKNWRKLENNSFEMKRTNPQKLKVEGLKNKNQDQHISKIDSTLENHTITKLIPEGPSNKINILQNILIDSKLPRNDQETLLEKNSEVESCKRFLYADDSDNGIDDVGKSDLSLRNNTLICNGLCFI
ncbi:hypothetical protein ILUMI_19547 [Ignelater luminosus]|uniref:HTH psq-type domain-containing protein n=1 Tax=Ignelater luminosus TaxID=2038154 RepID=A0A8K0CG15_IGNLU|nr:hypothetical protein ILUMI_19547 [Ignelater luminosus]